MSIAEQKVAYEHYLTERLDSGESQNIVIPTTARLIYRKVYETGRARVLDIGCFSGAMLNRIRRELAPEIQGSTDLVGADIDKEILKIGRDKYQGLDLRHADLRAEISSFGKFDIIILANIVHETLPETPAAAPIEIESCVSQTLNKVCGLLSQGGSLVILDGIKPPHEDNWLTITFRSSEIESLYLEFAWKYEAFPILIDKGGGLFRTRMKDLAAFMTKARYLHEEYWPIESRQNYQYFTESQFTEIISDCGMVIERIEPQRFPETQVGGLFKSIEPEVEFPAKNILIVAGKNKSY